MEKKRVSRNYWTKDILVPLALECSNKKEFRQKYPQAFSAASKKPFFKEITAHMVSLHESWSEERLICVALQCETKKELSEKFPKAYSRIIPRDDCEKFFSHMPKYIARNGEHSSVFKWSFDKLKECADQCETFIDFAKKFPSAYLTATRRNDFDAICINLKRQVSIPYTYEQIKEKALMFDNRSDFAEAFPSHYSAANRLKIWEELSAHMKISKTSSNPEQTILKAIREIYPSAKKLHKKKIFVPNKPYIKGFEIDIFVPELNKGIEYDSTKYHSFEWMIKSKCKKLWPEQDVRNYHEIKDTHFLTFGIKILHIKETEWKLDKEGCIKRCLDFLSAK